MLTIVNSARTDYSQRWQASPSNPAKHLHRPVVRSQMPALLHSALACAVVGPVGMSTQAASEGQTRWLREYEVQRCEKRKGTENAGM